MCYVPTGGSFCTATRTKTIEICFSRFTHGTPTTGYGNTRDGHGPATVGSTQIWLCVFKVENHPASGHQCEGTRHRCFWRTQNVCRSGAGFHLFPSFLRHFAKSAGGSRAFRQGVGTPRIQFSSEMSPLQQPGWDLCSNSFMNFPSNRRPLRVSTFSGSTLKWCLEVKLTESCMQQALQPKDVSSCCEKHIWMSKLSKIRSRDVS